MMQLYDRNFPPGWMARLGEPEIWQGIYDIDPGELWETHYALKNLLLAFVRRRLSRQCRRRGESDEAVEAARNILDPNILTIGFARRFATYKRADLILNDIDRMAEMVNDPRAAGAVHLRRQGPSGRRAGQAADQADRQPAASTRASPSRIVFIEDYDINVCRHLIQGVDVWLNNPAAAAGGLRHQRPEGGAQRGLEPLDPRRLVGRGLRRHQRLRHRQGHAARRRPHHRRPRRRRPVPRA